MTQFLNFKHHSKTWLLSTWALLFSLCFLQPLFAESMSVLLTPTRVILEGKTRSTTIKMINPNNLATTYKINLVSIRMDEYGNKVEAESPTEDELLAQKMIRFSPRRATLEPKAWQTIRLMVRKPKNLAPGEYRCQLKVAPISKVSTREDKNNEQGISIKINTVFNISIPVIVRHGTATVSVIPNPPQLISKKDKYYLETKLERKGLFSVFCDVTAFFIPANQETKRIEIGQRQAISIYTQNEYQIVHLPIEDKNILTNGKIELEISNREKKEPMLLGTKTFDYIQ